MTWSASWPALSPSTSPPPPINPFKPAPRFWKGNMCGLHVVGLPPVDGGAADSSLVLSWFYDRYQPASRTRIRAAWKAKGYTHVLLSWPDAVAAGATPESFRDIVLELIAEDFFPCVMWCSKDMDPPNVQIILHRTEAARALLMGIVPMICIGWELSLWLQPAQVQELVNAIAPPFAAYGCLTYVHFQQGYASFPPNTTPPQPPYTFGWYWAQQVGKLTGVLHQRVLTQTMDQYWYDSGGLVDILIRFAGGAGCPADSGFGHPFDLVALEICAQPVFNGEMTEAQADAWGTHAINCPPQHGPAGQVVVQGSGNGFL